MIIVNDRHKELLIKGSIVIASIFGLIFVPIIPLMMIFLNEKYESVLFGIWSVDFILFIVSGIIMMILMAVLKLKLKPQKAERIPLPVETMDELVEHIHASALQQQYQSHERMMLNCDNYMLVYTQKKLTYLTAFVIVRVPELTDEILELSNRKLTDFFTRYYGTDQITDWISVITVVCVDRITPSFQKLVNNNIQQGFKNFRLPVGISFGGKTIYISKQKDGYAITKYKKLRKEFLRMVGLPVQK